MKLLLDANISWRLATKLQEAFPETIHVNQSGLNVPASDTAIWQFAKKEGFIIVTNDDDFLRFSLQKGFPPYVVLLKSGNQSTNFHLEVLLKLKAAIEQMCESQSIGVLEVY